MTEPKKGEPGYEEWRGCKRKKRYDEPPNSPVLRHYRCKFCQGYHLTSKGRTGRQRREVEARAERMVLLGGFWVAR